jgi:hypothetical protein
MGAFRLTAGCLLFLCVAITGHAATFVKVDSTFKVSRNVYLDCPEADSPVERDWPFTEEVNDDPDGYCSWGHTPILKKGKAFLVSLNNNETARSERYYVDPDPVEESSIIPAGDPPYYDRVSTSVLQRPVFQVWQPGAGFGYSVAMHVRTSALAYYRIDPLDGEKIGDEVTLRVEGWTECEEYANGPDGTAIIQYTGPAGTAGWDNSAAVPGYVNQSDSIWHDVLNTRYFTARIGDTIGMQTSVYSYMEHEGIIKNWLKEYSPRNLFANSSISVSLVPKPLTGDIDNDKSITLGDAILALRVLSGQQDTIFYYYPDSLIDVNGDKRIGLEEALYVMQTLAETRQVGVPF